MDGTSPGFMPVSLGALGNFHSCGCYFGPWWGVTPPPRCAAHSSVTVPITTTTTTLRLMPDLVPTQRLSDADIERIARRVAEILREPGNCR